ncbi:MAG: co-chaperone GroES [Clostridia bacterium]|nr:co-chaperone GroES [Clostridia bacterium]
MILKPLGDKVVLKQIEAEEITKSGIILPSTAKEKSQEAIVIAVGTGGIVDGKTVPMEVNVGDKIIYAKYSGTDIKINDQEYKIVKQSDIIAVIEE